MARNEEKHAGRLNRLWLEKLDEEKEKKNPSRPGLGSLKTSEDVKKWIPSIKNDIDFYLKQSQVACYPERKLSEFSEKIEKLSKEYKAYLRKYRELEPGDAYIPWTDKPYSRKHKTSDVNLTELPVEKKCKPEFVPLATPILEEDSCYSELYGCSAEEPADHTVHLSLECTSHHGESQHHSKQQTHPKTVYYTKTCDQCKLCGGKNYINVNVARNNCDAEDMQSMMGYSKTSVPVGTCTCFCHTTNCCSEESDSVHNKACNDIQDRPLHDIQDLPLQFNYFMKSGKQTASTSNDSGTLCTNHSDNFDGDTSNNTGEPTRSSSYSNAIGTGSNVLNLPYSSSSSENSD